MAEVEKIMKTKDGKVAVQWKGKKSFEVIKDKDIGLYLLYLATRNPEEKKKIGEEKTMSNSFNNIKNDRIDEAYDEMIRKMNEDATADAKKTLDAIIGSLKDSKGQVAKSMYNMAMGMKKTFEKNKGFSKDQAEWIYKTSKALFK